MTCLSDGRVLVAGGSGPSGLSSSAEVYNPTAGTWSSAGTLPAAVHTQGAVLLNDGRVLIAGGNNASGPVNTAAIWSPSTNAWTATGSMATARAFYALNLLSDGRVLAAGGLVTRPADDHQHGGDLQPEHGYLVGGGQPEYGALQRRVGDARRRAHRRRRGQWRLAARHLRVLRQRAQHLDAGRDGLRRRQPDGDRAVAHERARGGRQHGIRSATTSAQMYGMLERLRPLRAAERDAWLLRSHQRGRRRRRRGGASAFGPQLVVGASATVQTNHNLVAPSVSLGSGPTSETCRRIR